MRENNLLSPIAAAAVAEIPMYGEIITHAPKYARQSEHR